MASPAIAPNVKNEADSRRTFAIISHPDAGKTTLTEKLLLMGGAIRMAGEVKAKGDRRRARSDWMKIEQQRGISVTTSVMTFIDGDNTYNLLDTPGHEDFSEDTFRTLTAVDSAVMVIDAAKGIEPQTKKLFEVCRLRDIPIITFINKMDRETKDPFELMDEISETLALDCAPMVWPIGSGIDFRGVYDLHKNHFVEYTEDGPVLHEMTGTDDPKLGEMIPADQWERLQEEAELAMEACPQFDMNSYREGHLCPVYFGSGLKNFGVRQLLNGIGMAAPSPRPQPTEERVIDPGENKVTGFVFKVQANMDPNHRDRIAFVRLVSGQFKRGMKLKHVRSGKPMAIYNPIMFFAQDRELAEEAWPGDIIGVPNHGSLRVGDALSESETIRFTGIPNFAPEILRRVRLDDPMKGKHLQKALESLAEEGVTQVFKPALGANWIVGVVGQLQLDVLVTRIQQEYSINVSLETAPFETARWVSSEDPVKLKTFMDGNRSAMGEDRDGAPVFLARNGWELNHQIQNHPDVRFDKTKERS
ncbi:peptide chain release factor 3 [Curvivirga aplysinae]|uniref:peptide chain release factor 3 n=1 Tax=Curvivirga aplysinae TaxID=2529852 RepID=UPI0012BCB1FC|nr:peptide chain release factor 3 [Curvivirga aplysinae]MTI09569.1 peptide chain release factor 3 [Curvivirga aplysinae]